MEGKERRSITSEVHSADGKCLGAASKDCHKGLAVDAICHGANLTAPGVLSADSGVAKDSVVAVFTLKGEAVALAKTVISTEEILGSTVELFAVSRRVVMPRGTYPRVWRSSAKE